MEKALKNGKISAKKGDLNGNGPALKSITKKTNGASLIKDHVTTADGRVFYPCQFCNKVFPIRKARAEHLKKCPAKDYILSVGEGAQEKQKEAEKPVPVRKIDVQQNIIINKKTEVVEAPKSPLKMTIRRSPSNGNQAPDHFTVSNNSLVLKEKNESTDDFTTIAKRLQNNSVTIIKQPVKEDKKNFDDKKNCNDGKNYDDDSKNYDDDSKKYDDNDNKSSEDDDVDDDDNKNDSNETACRECAKEFASPLELLRHSRKCHSYPKVMMAMSEIKKFYATKDRSECPICHKPLKNNFRSAFIKHLHTHTSEMKYACHVCNRKFRRSDHMKAHEKRHIVKNEK